MLRSSKLRVMVVAAALAMAGGCGDGEDRPGTVSAESGTGSASGSASGSVSGSASASGTGAVSPPADDGYEPVSDVQAHAAIGEDAAQIRTLLASAKEGNPVDWAAVGAKFREGGASMKGDGSPRTLATLVEDHPAVEVVNAAIAGTGAAAGTTDAERAQQVDKGITVLLAAKVEGELAAAAEKVADGDIEPASGAPHNVDEAWAFFTAQGQGPASTADKRGADFELGSKVREDVVAALTEAKEAAVAGDAGALGEAAEATRHGLDKIFYLATYKYLDHKGDPVARAEGASFYLGIASRVREASPASDDRIRAAFAAGDGSDGRVALHDPAVLAALGIDDSERVDRG